MKPFDGSNFPRSLEINKVVEFINVDVGFQERSHFIYLSHGDRKNKCQRFNDWVAPVMVENALNRMEVTIIYSTVEVHLIQTQKSAKI